jgi:hypothetical protein
MAVVESDVLANATMGAATTESENRTAADNIAAKIALRSAMDG